MSFDPVLGPIGLLLLYLAPGLGLTFAVFPEKFGRRVGWEGAVEVTVLAIVVSVAVTILLGSALAASPTGFSATWSAPSLLVGDGAIAIGGALLGILRWRWTGAGGFPAPEEGEPEAWQTLRTFEQLAREERNLRRSLRRTGTDESERTALEARLTRLQTERESLRRAREGELAS